MLEPDTFDRIPKDTAWSIERSYFPSLVERGETFVAYMYRGYWIDIGTPEKYVAVHRDIMDGRFEAPPFAGRASRRVMDRTRRARSMRARRSTGRASSTRASWSRPARASARTPSSAGRCHVEEDAPIDGCHRLAQLLDWPRGGRRRRGAVLGRNCHVGRNVDRRERRHGARRQDRRDGLHAERA